MEPLFSQHSIRPSKREPNALREISFQPHVAQHAEGSCLVKFGDTHVLCTASVEERTPRFLRDTGAGWITAEYSMLPRATHQRKAREIYKVSGRTMEIQRLIGRSLRAVVDLRALGERQVIIDCDVLQADGGTRTAAITGGYVALKLAFQKLIEDGYIRRMPLTDELAAISCGVYKGVPVVDLEYEEDRDAEIDANFVMTGRGQLVEIQATGEQNPFSKDILCTMMSLAEGGIQELIALQRKIS